MRKSKYSNQKTNINGIVFASKKEGNYYLILRDKENKKEISNLQLQVPFILQDKYKINNKSIREIKYIADFTYIDNGVLIIVDVKASKFFKTDVYKLKKKLFEYKYQIEITEIY